MYDQASISSIERSFLVTTGIKNQNPSFSPILKNVHFLKQASGFKKSRERETNLSSHKLVSEIKVLFTCLSIVYKIRLNSMESLSLSVVINSVITIFCRVYFLIFVPKPIMHNLHRFFIYDWKDVSQAQKYFT